MMLRDLFPIQRCLTACNLKALGFGIGGSNAVPSGFSGLGECLTGVVLSNRVN